MTGSRAIWLSASIQYWRHDPAVWPRLLDRAVECGFPAVETYMPWSVHEVAPGEFDFGAHDKTRDVARFVDLCSERGLAVIARPGPHINAELTWFGYPRRVLADPRCQGRNAAGAPVYLPAFPHPFPAPSYASPIFLDETERWLRALREALGDRVGAGRPIAAVQSDNECCFVFRAGTYDLDYSPGARGWWTEFLRRRFGGNIDQAAHALRATAHNFDELAPPTQFEAHDLNGAQRHMLWAAFKEHLIVRSVTEIRERLERAGFTGVTFTHNLPTVHAVTPFNIPALERDAVSVAGIDLYHPRRDYPLVRHRANVLVGQSRQPYIPEHACGVWPLWEDVGPVDWLLSAWTVLMHGVAGINFYMFAERERWVGSPVDRHGNVRADAFARLKEFVRLAGQEGLLEARPVAPVGLIVSRPAHRLAAVMSLLEPAPNFLLRGLGYSEAAYTRDDTLGLNEPWHQTVPERERQLEARLRAERVPFCVVDSEFPLAGANPLKVLILPPTPVLTRRALNELLTFLERGGVVWTAPPLPLVDERGEPLPFTWATDPAGDRFVTIGRGCLRIARSAEALLSGDRLTMWPPLDGCAPPIGCDDPAVDVALRERGRQRVLFAANPSREARVARLTLRGAGALRDLTTGETLNAYEPGRFAESLSAWTIRVFAIEEA